MNESTQLMNQNIDNNVYYLPGPSKIKAIIHLSDLHIRGESDNISLQIFGISNCISKFISETQRNTKYQN